MSIREAITASGTWKHFQQFNIFRVSSQNQEQTESQIYSDVIQMEDKSGLKIPVHALCKSGNVPTPFYLYLLMMWNRIMGGCGCHLFHKVLGAILNICQTCHSLSVRGGMKFHIILDYFSYQLSHRIHKVQNALVYPESDLPFFQQIYSMVVKFHTNLTVTPVRNGYNRMGSTCIKLLKWTGEVTETLIW